MKIELELTPGKYEVETWCNDNSEVTISSNDYASGIGFEVSMSFIDLENIYMQAKKRREE